MFFFFESVYFHEALEAKAATTRQITEAKAMVDMVEVVAVGTAPLQRECSQ